MRIIRREDAAVLILTGSNFNYFMLFKLIVFLSLVPVRHLVNAPDGYPVILVPGDGGSQLHAKLDKPTTVHRFCSQKTTDFFELWLNLEQMVPVVMDCWVDNIRLVYDNRTRTTQNSPGVDIKIPDFGNTSTVEWLDSSQISYGAYFKFLATALVELGYVRGDSIRGAPYDFRKAPNEHLEYFANIKSLIESTTAQNGGKPVVLVGHSMGCSFMLYFLNQQTQAWKDQYIRALVTLAGVWGGAVKALRVFASGDNLGYFVFSALSLRQEQRTSPSLAFVLPTNMFWGSEEILLFSGTRNYTVQDYQEFFQDLNYTTGYDMWKDTKDLIYRLKPPGVEVHCLHGVNVTTEESLVYTNKTFPDGPPTFVEGDGDGTVNLRSLLGCLSWDGKQKQKVYHATFPGVDHMSIMSHQPVIDYIKEVVTSKKGAS